jgi:hypothetical protein
MVDLTQGARVPRPRQSGWEMHQPLGIGYHMSQGRSPRHVNTLHARCLHRMWYPQQVAADGHADLAEDGSQRGIPHPHLTVAVGAVVEWVAWRAGEVSQRHSHIAAALAAVTISDAHWGILQ